MVCAKTIPIGILKADAFIQILSKIHTTSAKELIRHGDVLIDGKIIRFPLEAIKGGAD